MDTGFSIANKRAEFNAIGASRYTDGEYPETGLFDFAKVEVSGGVLGDWFEFTASATSGNGYVIELLRQGVLMSHSTAIGGFPIAAVITPAFASTGLTQWSSHAQVIAQSNTHIAAATTSDLSGQSVTQAILALISQATSQLDVVTLYEGRIHAAGEAESGFELNVYSQGDYRS